ncbi:MAG: hypothetical protein DCC52_11840, partial [Chloroflexi bacterium]
PAPDQILQFIAQNMVNIVTQNRELVRVLFTAVPLMDETLRAEYIQQMPLYAMEALENYIRAMQKTGVFRADLDAAIVARIYPGMALFFLLVQEVLQPPGMTRFDYARVLPVIVEIYLRGILQADAPTRQRRRRQKKAPSRKTRTVRRRAQPLK